VGSPWLAVLGGVLVGAAAALALRYAYLGIDLFLWPVAAAPLVVAGAVVGYNLRRRPSPRARRWPRRPWSEQHRNRARPSDEAPVARRARPEGGERP
jgi:hypothetical protein